MPGLLETLQAAGSRDDVDLFCTIHAIICECFRPATAKAERSLEALARDVWCVLRGKRDLAGPGTNPGLRRSLGLEPFPSRVCYRIQDQKRGIKLVFWTQRSGPGALRQLPESSCWLPGPRPLRAFVAMYLRGDAT